MLPIPNQHFIAPAITQMYCSPELQGNTNIMLFCLIEINIPNAISNMKMSIQQVAVH